MVHGHKNGKGLNIVLHTYRFGIVVDVFNNQRENQNLTDIIRIFKKLNIFKNSK